MIFPETITQADSVEEGLEIATDFLDEALYGRLRLGKSLPEPSTLEKGQYLIDVPVQTAVKVLLNNTLRDAQLFSSLRCKSESM